MFPTCFWYWALHNQTRGFINNIGYSHIPATKFLNHLSDLGIDNALGCFGFAPPPPLWQPPKCDRTDNINEIEKIYLPKNEAPISLSKLVTYIFIFLRPESIVFWWFNWDIPKIYCHEDRRHPNSPMHYPTLTFMSYTACH
jgi:hypothetical protein